MTIYLNCARVVLAAGALALAGLSVPAPAHADQYDFVVYLDNNGVYYSSVSGVIDAGKMTCRILRSGGGVPAAMGFLGRAGYHHRRRCRRYVPGHAARDRCLPEPDCGRQRRAGMTVDHLDSRCESETPRPRPRPRRVDLAFAQPRPVESIVIDVAESHLGYCYVAVSVQRSWSGVVAAPNAEVAVLNAIDEIWLFTDEGVEVVGASLPG